MFSPAKYGIIPEIVEKEKISRANGLITSFTYLAIISGTFLASFLTEVTHRNYVLTASFCLLVAVAGFFSAARIEETAALGGKKKINPLFIREIIHTLIYCKNFVHLLPCLFGAAFFLFLGAFIYVAIYTIWLKPRTLLNIVIGGAAGSAAVLSGSAAAGQWHHVGALVLAGILFLWTPFHFWSLAILYKEEYRHADVPMLPVRTTPRAAALWVMTHTLPTAVFGLLLVTLPALGWVYFVPVLAVTADLFVRNIQLITDPSQRNARALFISSNLYLLVLLLAICVDTMLPL